MALDSIINTGNSTAGKANVNSNYELQTALTTTAANAGYAKIAGKDGTALKIISTGYVPASLEALLFYDTIDGAAVNTNLWNQSTSTMTITQANGFINLNPTNSTTANAYAILSSIDQYFLTSCMPLHIHHSLQSSLFNVPINTVCEWGWMTCATNAAPTDGVFLRVRAGTLYGVINNNGTETETAAQVLPNANQTYEFVLDIYADQYKVFQDGNQILSVSMPVSQAAVVNTSRNPIALRVYNTSSVPASSATLKLGQISVQQRNANWDLPFMHKMASIARGAYQSPVTTFAQTTNHANSTSPTSATLSNTAAGYATWGGRYQFAAPAGAATDFALFAYQVPAGFQAIITDVRISAMNTGATVATTATILDWSIGVNSSAVSLATVDGAGTWAPRRIPLGMHGFRVGDLVGYRDADIAHSFATPLSVDGGRYVHIIVQVPVGTATGSQVIRGDVYIGGYVW